MPPNIVYRKCLKCNTEGLQEDVFSYRGDGVWSCHYCRSMWTEVSRIINEEMFKGEK